MPVQIGQHFWPDFTTLTGIRIDYLSPVVYLTDLLIATLVVQVYLTPVKQKVFAPLKSWLFGGFMFVILTAAFISSGNVWLTLYGCLKVLEIIFFACIAKYLLQDKLTLKLLPYSLSISLVVESVVGIFQAVKHGSIGGLFYFLGERSFNSLTPGIANAEVNGSLIFRPYATFSHPNVFAGFLVIGMIFLLNFLLQERVLLKKIYFAAVIVLGTTALFYTLSRAAVIVWFMSGLTIIIAHWLNATNDRKIKLVNINVFYMLSMLIIFITTLIMSPLGTRIAKSNFHEEAIAKRINQYKQAAGVIKKNLLFGAGMYQYLPALEAEKAIHGVIVNEPVHNIFLLYIAQTGLIGGLFSILFLYQTFNKLKKELASKKMRMTTILKIILLGIVFALGIGDHYFLTLQQGQLLLGFVLGFIWVV